MNFQHLTWPILNVYSIDHFTWFALIERNLELNMKALILAAGRGSRMKGLTDDRPKCLVKLHGKTLLERQLKAIRNAGITEVGIVTGYKCEMLGDFGLKQFHNPRWNETNMVSSLTCASEWLELEPCIVSYSDIFYSSEAVTSLIQHQSKLAITYDPDWKGLWESRFGNPLIDAETFRLNSEQNVVEIGNKPKSINEIEGQYMGLLRFTPDSWREVMKIRASLNDNERDSMHMTGTLQRIIDGKTIQVNAISYRGYWGEVDSEEDLAVYRDYDSVVGRIVVTKNN